MKKKATKKRKVSSSRIETAKKRRQAAFLEAFKECATVTHAAEIAKVGRRTHYDWLKKDPAYVEAFEEAEIAAIDTLIQEARRRAVQGVSEPVYHKGEVVGAIQKYSDSLLMFLMKGAMPGKYRDNHHVTVDGTVNLVKLMNEGRGRVEEDEKAHP